MPLSHHVILPYKVPPMPRDYIPVSAHWFGRYDALSAHCSSGILAPCARPRHWTPICNHEQIDTSHSTCFEYARLVGHGDK